MLTRAAQLFLLILIAGTMAAAQSPDAASMGADEAAANPVAHARQAKSWEYGPFVNWGTGVGDRSDFKFFAPGFQLGKSLGRPVHAGLFSGQFELAGNFMPLWQAYTPAPHTLTYPCPEGDTCYYNVGGGTYTGLSLTPVILRWNFLTHSRRFQPWFQGAGGLIYTSHKFPPEILVPHGVPGGTSVFNFSPQGGVGLHYFTSPRRSIDLGVNAVHIS